MLISELCAALPFPVLHSRIANNEVPAITHIHYLTEPSCLSDDTLYLLQTEEARALLPDCSCQSCATVLCLGAGYEQIVCGVTINLIQVDSELVPLINFLSSYFAEMRRHSAMQAEQVRSKFASIVENKLENGETVEKLCSSFPKKLKTTYCVICIQTPSMDGKILNETLMQEELAKLFPEDNFVPYDNDLIIIHSYNGFYYPPKLPTEQLSRILQKYNAQAGISNGVQKPEKLRMMYILSRQALEMGKRHHRDRVIFFYDDMMLYNVVSLAAESFRTLYDDDDINLLGNPVLINLVKHDLNGKKDLVETLYQYIINGCSTSRAAEAMHLHRNTVQNRISLIEDIAGKGLLSDGIFQAKFLITYYIVHYSTKIWHRELVLTPLYDPAIGEKAQPQVSTTISFPSMT